MGVGEIKNYIIGVVMAMVIVAGGVFLLSQFYNRDNTIDSAGQVALFNATLNKADNVNASVNQIGTNIASVNSQDTGLLGWLNSLIGMSYNALKSVVNSMSFVLVAATHIGTIFGVPEIDGVISLISSIILVIIGIAIIAAILRVYDNS